MIERTVVGCSESEPEEAQLLHHCDAGSKNIAFPVMDGLKQYAALRIDI
jgi:hypothetical protein